jgi:hypothetical protein
MHWQIRDLILGQIHEVVVDIPTVVLYLQTHNETKFTYYCEIKIYHPLGKSAEKKKKNDSKFFFRRRLVAVPADKFPAFPVFTRPRL